MIFASSGMAGSRSKGVCRSCSRVLSSVLRFVLAPFPASMTKSTNWSTKNWIKCVRGIGSWGAIDTVGIRAAGRVRGGSR